MGSEMCIRDRVLSIFFVVGLDVGINAVSGQFLISKFNMDLEPACLLYTSDAADERSSVDLGGRRIIKNKNDE